MEDTLEFWTYPVWYVLSFATLRKRYRISHGRLRVPPNRLSLPLQPVNAPSEQPKIDVLVAEEEELESRTIHVPRYHVILFDDDHHSYEYVIEMLIDLFGHTLSRAFSLARKVDSAGWVILDTTTRERAELKRDQIHEYGADWRIEHCKGSMSATIEEAE